MDKAILVQTDKEGKITAEKAVEAQEMAYEAGYQAGVEKVVKWVEDNCIGVNTPTNNPENYIGIQLMEWQAFKLRQEEHE